MINFSCAGRNLFTIVLQEQKLLKGKANPAQLQTSNIQTVLPAKAGISPSIVFPAQAGIS
jgi:hypothetical protein